MIRLIGSILVIFGVGLLIWLSIPQLRSVKFVKINQAFKKVDEAEGADQLVGLAISSKKPRGFYAVPNYQRLSNVWKKDVARLGKNKEFKKILDEIGTVEMIYTDPQVADEMQNLKSPFKEKASGLLTAKVQVIRLIDKDQYGFVLQHDIIDQNNNKIYEFGRTYMIGIYW